MLIDEVTINISGGKGGDGCVAFDNSKGGVGPTGANGGKGGNVYFQATSDLSALNQFRFKKIFNADNGENGRNRLLDGKNGNDLFLKIPIGTIISNLDNQTTIEFTKPGEQALLAKGGKGGKGNWFFRSSRNTTPKEFEYGKMGQSFQIHLELKFIAHIGLVGLPNAGKSSLLNSLTKAKAKVAAYPFTTLEPNLGDFYGMIIADIPGLIEGAAAGKGLGIKFLKHIQRTQILIHCISAESHNILQDYHTIKQELAKYDPELIQKPEYVFLTKTDLLKPQDIKKQLNILYTVNKNSLPISIQNPDSLKNLNIFFSNLKNQVINDTLPDSD